MTADPAPPQRLTTGQVVRDAVVLMRQTFDAAWPWWFFLFVLQTASAAQASLNSPAVAPGHAPPPPTPLALGLALGAGAVGILLGAFALRVMVTGKAERPRPNGGFWAYAGLTLAAAGAGTAVTLLTAPLAEQAILSQAAAKPATDLLPLMVAALAGFLVMALVFARLVLWPVALLAGEKGLGPVASWRRMRGAVWPLIAGTLLLVLPVTLIGSSVLMLAPTLPLASAPVVGLMGALEGALQLAVTAAVYRARVKAPPIVLPPKPASTRG